MSLYIQIVEYTYNNVMAKQRSINSLWPKFTDKVSKVRSNGGVNLAHEFPEVWEFEVASGTTPGKKYAVMLRFKNIPEMLKKFVPDRRLWNKEEDAIDYNLLGPEVLNKVDIELDCQCLADTYWGMEYIRTQKKAQFGHEENRPPKIKNPKQYGVACKHIQALLTKLPSYNFTFNGFLKSFYEKDIQKLVEETRKRLGLVKQVAKELGKKKEEVGEEPVSYARGGKPVEVPPEEEKQSNESKVNENLNWEEIKSQVKKMRGK